MKIKQTANILSERLLAGYLGYGAYPATALGLARRLKSQQAPTSIILALQKLPANHQFRDLTEVCDALGVTRPGSQYELAGRTSEGTYHLSRVTV